MKKIIWLAVFLFVFSFQINVSAYDGNLNLKTVPYEVDEGEQMVIKFNDVGADYYVLSASCKDNVIVDGKERLNLCDKDLKIYPTGKDVIAVYGFYPSVIGYSTNFQLSIAAYKNGLKTKVETQTIEINDVLGEKDTPLELESSISPNPVTEGEFIKIRFNDVGADYYILSASCKDGVSVGGKARPDICYEGEKIYPTGKDVILVDGFYPSVTGNDSTFQLAISAYQNESKIKVDTETVKIKNVLGEKDDKPEVKGNKNDIEILKLVVTILNIDKPDSNTKELIQFLELIIKILESQN